VAGEGEPLLLLHGFGGTGERWDWCIDEFSREYQLIVPDHRGHGRSTNPTGEFTNRQAALDAFALLDSLGIETFKGMGVSTGAMVLLHMATIDPGRVEGMVLVSGTPYYPEQARAMYRSYAPDNLPPGAFENVGRSHARGAEQARELAEQFYSFKDSYKDMSFTPPHLATITAQTLIVHGDRDEFFPVEMAFELYEAIPNSYLWVFPNAGHPPYVGSDRGLAIFSETAREFLRGEWFER
jgi:pimeloyl-ACP methyl ester carboxylesterase